MNNIEIGLALSNNPVTKATFKGTFSSDTVPLVFFNLPGACIINTAPSEEPGKHWVAIYQPCGGKPEFFDSFGKQAEFYKLDLPMLTDGYIKQDLQI